MKTESQLLRFQTALICEAFIGKGQGVKYVMDSWKLEESESKELTADQVKQLLKAKRERDALKKLNK